VPVRLARSAGVSGLPCHRSVQAEFVADENEPGVERGRDVLYDLPKNLHLALIQLA
jgi:hypothetical protein